MAFNIDEGDGAPVGGWGLWAQGPRDGRINVTPQTDAELSCTLTFNTLSIAADKVEIKCGPTNTEKHKRHFK